MLQKKSTMDERGCLVCGSTKLRPWAEKNGYSIKKCLNCSHVSVNPMLSIEKIEEGYTSENNPFVRDENYYEVLKRGEKTHNAGVYQMAVDMIRRFRVEELKGRWLDIGAGSGYVVQQARLGGWDAIGLEPGPWGQLAAKEREIPIIYDFFEQHDFGEESFDIITALDVMEHTRDPKSFLQRCKSILRPLGLIVMSVPCSTSPHGWTTFVRTRWPMVGPPTHLHYFSKKSLPFLLEEQGFCLLQYKTFEVSGFSVLGKYCRPIAKVQDKLYRFVVEHLNLGDQVIAIAEVNKKWYS